VKADPAGALARLPAPAGLRDREGYASACATGRVDRDARAEAPGGAETPKGELRRARPPLAGDVSLGTIEEACHGIGNPLTSLTINLLHMRAQLAGGAGSPEALWRRLADLEAAASTEADRMADALRALRAAGRAQRRSGPPAAIDPASAGLWRIAESARLARQAKGHVASSHALVLRHRAIMDACVARRPAQRPPASGR